VIDLESDAPGHSQATPAGWSPLARGALETLATISGYCAAGFFCAAVFADSGPGYPGLRDASAQTIYAGGMIDEPLPSSRAAPSIWLVDGFNVLHTGLLGGRDRSKWWTESKRQELLERVESFEDAAAELWIVFDGHRDAPDSHDGAGPRCLFAPSADTWLVDRVREADDPSQLVVVTADRQVAGRARSRGAQVVSPRDFLARCPV
jgi:predicted RNA-binding protein with PIN domain